MAKKKDAHPAGLKYLFFSEMWERFGFYGMQVLMVTYMLKKLGYTLITAGDGREAIGIYRERRDAIDIVILDVMMPVMSGNEAFEELKKINPDIRVAVSSGYGEDPRIDEMFAKGARGFIQKPYTMETLAKEISRIMMKK